MVRNEAYMIGYKVFRGDWTLSDYPDIWNDSLICAVGETYKIDKPFIPKKNCFTFQKNVAHCFEGGWPFNPCCLIVAEIDALGPVVVDERTGIDYYTDEIKIIRKIEWPEVLELANFGTDSTGYCNVGSINSGSHNTGHSNSGDYNVGHANTGDWNTGNYNFGRGNTGCWNRGNENTGDWNTTSHSTGCFNTKEQKIYMFNKPSKWTFHDWETSKAYRLLYDKEIVGRPVTFISFYDMDDNEKKAHPEAKERGGYLKSRSVKDDPEKWWDNLSPDERSIILDLPNFDAEIFKEITGIDVNKN